MRKFKLFFACLLMAVLSIGQVWGGDKTGTFDLTTSNQTSPVEDNGVTFSWTTDQIVLGSGCGFSDKNKSGDADMTVTIPAGATLKSISKVNRSGAAWGGAARIYVYAGTSTSGTLIATIETGTPSYNITSNNTGTTYYFINNTGANAWINSISVEYTEATTTHTVSATSNNSTWGTVSVNGTTITATPADCYQVASGDGGYSLSSGTASAISHVGNTNTISVTPTSNCSIQVIFEPKPTNTYIDEVQGNAEQTLCATTAPSLDDEDPATSGSCKVQHYHFVGWVSEANRTTPTDLNIVKAGETIAVDGTTYYAVWAKGVAGDAFDGTAGGSFYIYADISGTKYYSTGFASQMLNSTNIADAALFTFEKIVEDETTYFAIKSGTKYLGWSSGANFTTNGTDPYKWLPTAGEHGSWRLKASSGLTRSIVYRAGTTNKFAPYSISNINGTEYYDIEIGAAVEYSDYITVCCTKYDVAIADGITNGSVSADVADACEGTTVTLTFTPALNCHLTGWTLNGTPQDIADNTFTMPGEAVTVSATFAQDACEPLGQPSVTVSGKVYPYNAVKLAWTAISNANKYKVYIYDNDDHELEHDDAFTGTEYTIGQTLSGGTTYKYSVQAISNTPATYCPSTEAEGTFDTEAVPTPQLNLVLLKGEDAVDGDTHTINVEFDLPTTAASCSKTLVGWTTEAYKDHEGADKPAVLLKKYTFTSTDAVTLYAVYATKSGSEEDVDITIDTENFPTSYGGANTFTEYTLDGKKFKIQQGYINQGKLQWRAAGHDNGTGTMYNTEALEDLTSIVLTYNNSDGGKNFTIKVGTAENPTEGTVITPSISGNVYTFDCTGGSYQYFVMANGSGAGYLDEITVNYGDINYSAYSTTCSAKVATPVISGVTDGETYTTEKEITITCGTAGAAIYYTTNGDEPTTSSTLYTAPFTLDERGDYTIRAIAVKNDMPDSDEAEEVSFTLNLPFTSIADLIGATPTTSTSYQLKFVNESNAIITAVNSTNRYIQDASGKGIVIRSTAWDANAIQGKKITGTITGSWNVYNGQKQLENATFEGMTFADASSLPTAYAYDEEKTIEQNFESHQTALVKLSGVRFAAETLTSRQVTMQKGVDSYTFADAVYKIGHMQSSTYIQDYKLPLSSTTCDVTGLLIYYSTTTQSIYEFVPVNLEAIDTKGADAVLPTFEAGSTDAANPQEVASGKNIGFTLAEGYDAVYAVNDGAENPIESNTVVTISNTENATKLYVKATRDFYDDADVTYYYIANPALVEHSIICATGLEGGSISASASSAAAGIEITLTPSAEEHYSFGSWNVTYNDGEVKTIDVVNNKFEMPAYEVNVSATFIEEKKYTIVFDANDVNATGAAPSVVPQYANATFNVPGKNTLAVEGKRFAGWKVNDVLVGATYTTPDVIPTAPTTITFVAQWKDIPDFTKGVWKLVEDASEVAAGAYVIIADDSSEPSAAMSTEQKSNNRGQKEVTIANKFLTYTTTTDPDPAIFEVQTGNVVNSKATVAFYDDANNGYIYAASSGSNYLRTESSISDNSSWIVSISGDVTNALAQGTNTRNKLLYNATSSLFSCYADHNAQTEDVAFYKFYIQVTFNANEGSAVDPVYVEYDESVAAPADPIRDGYRFNGWKLNSAAYDFNSKLTENITLVADWSQLYAVNYAAGEGSGDAPAAAEYVADETFDLAAANLFTAPAGKEFDGWLCNVDAAKYAAGAEYTMTAAATTFTAQWKQITYAVTYVSAHGTAPDATNAAAVTLEALTADGWTHNGWVANVDVEVDDATVTAGTPIANGKVVVLSAATEFTAQWIEDAPTPVYEIVRSGLEAGRHYTVCLEKKVTAVKGATFWSLTYKNSENTAAYLVQEETPFAAGTPYIIQATDDNDGKLEVAYEGDAVGAPVENGALRGTFGNMTASDLNAINVAPNMVYMLFENELRPIGTNNHLDAHRAYVLYNLLTVPSTSNFAPGKKVKSMPLQKDVATGMDELNASETPVKVMIDGKFYILRGEKMYDATGKLVK